jgi:hypothetical protein
LDKENKEFSAASSMYLPIPSFPVFYAVRRGDVLSAWSGIRPLVTNPNSKDTQSLARNHIIEVSNSNLITIAGQRTRILANKILP